VQGDTGIVRAGNGHGGARSMHMGGSALVKTVNTMLEKAKPIAARLLQAAQVDFANGRFTVTGEPAAGIDLLAVAAAVQGTNESLDTYVWNLLDVITFPNGCHIAEVEVDPETGHVALERYTAVDDFGTLINPMLTLGQIHGGVAQGIGQAMMEHTVYDPDTGQLLSGSFMDYALPRSNDLPDFEITLTGVPTNANPLGVKGAGQAGAIAAPQAVVLAVIDAIGTDVIDMPLTPERVWRAIQQGKRP
jgi:aerobic carbon-monoxide dehydrogenase large subunit